MKSATQHTSLGVIETGVLKKYLLKHFFLKEMTEINMYILKERKMKVLNMKCFEGR
jgi:hypothetical protein